MSLFFWRSVEASGRGGSGWGGSKEVKRLEWNTRGAVAHLPQQRHGQSQRLPAQGRHSQKHTQNMIMWIEFSEFQRSADLKNPFPPLQQQPPQLSKEQGLDVSLDQDPIRQHAWYLSRKQRQRLLDEHGVQGWTVVQFLGDSVLIPAGAMHQVFTTHTHTLITNW